MIGKTKWFIVAVELSSLLRKKILTDVKSQWYFYKEEDIFLPPIPARSMVELIETNTLISLGFFINKYYSARNRKFQYEQSLQEYSEFERAKNN